MPIAPVAGSTFNLQNLDFSPDALWGSVYYRGEDYWTSLPPGVSGQVLKSNGGSADVGWLTLPGGGDMLAATYDPTAVAGDVFNLANKRIAAEVRGDILIRGAVNWERLPIGTNGYALVSNGAGSNPSWQAVGDMSAAVYDPTAVAGDVFDFANMAIAAEAAGDMLARGPGAWQRIAASSTPGRCLVSTGGSVLPTWDLAPMQTGGISGARLTVPTAATVQIEAGAVRDDGDQYDLRWAAPLTVDLTASGVGGLDTGVEAANTWYAVWAIRQVSPATPALLLAVLGAAPTMPGSYTRKRLVGIVYNDTAGDLVPTAITRGPDGRARLVLLCGATTRTINLFAGATHADKVSEVVAKDKAGTATLSPITINRAGAETIDGATSLVLDSDYAAADLVFYGTEWSLT